MSDRHQFRADWHDYKGGIYFVTICCDGKRHYFGEIVKQPVGTRFIASALGRLVDEEIQKIPSYYDYVEIWNYVVMPNHIHLVVAIEPTEMPQVAPPNNMGCLKQRRHEAPESQDFHHNSRLASTIGAFKAGVTRLARTRKLASSEVLAKIWQTRFHEHIILEQHVFDNIMNYIDDNVANWFADCHNNNGINNADAMNRVPTSML